MTRIGACVYLILPYGTEVIVAKEHSQLIVPHGLVQLQDAVVCQLRAVFVEELFNE